MLNEELARDYGATLTLRIGVNTGEVVTGTAERLATGDAVVVAARLEQGAPPGEILVGEETVRLVRRSVEVGPLEKSRRRERRSHSPRTACWRSRTRRRSAPTGHRSSDETASAACCPTPGNERRRSAPPTCSPCSAPQASASHGFPRSSFPGSATTRASFAGGASYGEGVTYWPVVEILKQLLGSEPAAVIAELVLDDVAAASLLGLLGEGSQPASPELVSWSVRKLLEAVAESTPLVVVLDDLQWAEPTLLDLVEHVADLSRDAPILLLCLAPDLLDRRPAGAAAS